MENEGIITKVINPEQCPDDGEDALLTGRIDKFLMRAGWSAIAILGVLGSTMPGQIIFGVRAVYIGILRIMKKVRPNAPEQRPVPWLFLALMGWLFVAALLSLDRGKAIAAVTGYTLTGLLAVMAARYILKDEEFSKRRLMPLLIIAGGQVGGWLAYSVFIVGLQRGSLPFTSGPNGSGMILAVAAIFLLGYILDQKRRISLLLLVPWFLTAAGIAATLSRGALIGLAAGLLVYMSRWKRIFIIFIIVMLIVGWGASRDPVMSERMSRFFELEYNSARIYIWSAALQMIEDHPIFGIGADNYSVIFPEYREKIGYPAEGVDFAHSHNIFLEVTLAGGIPALIIFLLILCRALRSACRVSRRGGGMSIAPLAVMVTLLFHLQLDMIIGGINKLFVFAIPFALTMEMERLERRGRDEKSQMAEVLQG